MAPHCGVCVFPGLGFTCALRQIVMLLVVVHAPGGFGGTQGVGTGGLEFTGICAGSILDACITPEIVATTVASRLGPPAHVAHDDRAATIAPCCAACVIVE